MRCVSRRSLAVLWTRFGAQMGDTPRAYATVLPPQSTYTAPRSRASSIPLPKKTAAKAEPTASPPLLLDPPFTPVMGESAVSGATMSASSATPRLVYRCVQCRTPIFSSEHLVDGSGIGHHRSGWPTFTRTVSSRPLRRRAVLQRGTVRALEQPLSSASPSPSSTSASTAPRASSAASLRNSLASVASTTTSLTTRGLSVEADVCRVPGRGVQPQTTRTWREQTLRDVNHRADPALLEACCPSCERAVCRLVTTRSGDVRYVSTACAIVATTSDLKNE